MYEMIQVSDRTWYMDCPSKVGFFQTKDDQVWCIDSGNDKDMARRICRVLDEMDWTLAGVVNTHSNADHIGANAALVRRTGCKLVGTGMENCLTRYPVLEPSLLYGGYPMKALRNKFLMAAESIPDGTVDAHLPQGLEAVPLPGHFLDMCGIRTADDILFVADSVFPQATIDRYHVFFVYDVAAFLATLDRLERMQARLYIPSHAEPTEDIAPLVRLNRQKALEIIDLLCSLCAAPLNFEDILKGVFDHHGLTLDINQYALVGSTVKSYLAYLCDTGKLEPVIADNLLLFKKI